MSDTGQTAAITPATEAPEPKRGAAALVAVTDRGVQLRNLDDLLRFARMAVAGGAAPRGMTEGAAAIAIQAGMERGLGPLGGLQNIVVINGIASWRGQGAAALIQNSPACLKGTFRFGSEGSGDQMVGWATAQRTGYTQPERRTFSVEDARRAHLWGKSGPWQEYPGRMLAWRALGLLARDVFPDVLGGFPLAEEAEDFGAPAPMVRTERTALPAPASPDPLMAQLGVEAAPVIDVKAEPVAPFPSHAEER